MGAIHGRYDGGNYAGIGSIVQIQQHAYAYAKMNNLDFHFPGFKHLSHYQYQDISQDEFCSRITNFYNIPSDTNDVGQQLDESYLIKRWGEQFLNEKKTYINELSKHIKYDGPIYFDKSKINVAIHIRNENSCDLANDLSVPYREMYQKGGTKDSYFLSIIKNLVNNLTGKINLLIFSQGNLNDFSHFLKYDNVNLYINHDIIETIYHLIFSNILVTSNSSLSWSSHLFGCNNLVISRYNHAHNWYSDTILTDINGNFVNIENYKLNYLHYCKIN